MKAFLYRFVSFIVVLTLIVPPGSANAIESLLNSTAKKDNLAPYSVAQLMNELEEHLDNIVTTPSGAKPALPRILEDRKSDFNKAVAEFQERERRLGG